MALGRGPPRSFLPGPPSASSTSHRFRWGAQAAGRTSLSRSCYCRRRAVAVSPSASICSLRPPRRRSGPRSRSPCRGARAPWGPPLLRDDLLLVKDDLVLFLGDGRTGLASPMLASVIGSRSTRTSSRCTGTVFCTCSVTTYCAAARVRFHVAPCPPAVPLRSGSSRHPWWGRWCRHRPCRGRSPAAVALGLRHPGVRTRLRVVEAVVAVERRLLVLESSPSASALGSSLTCCLS